MSDSSGSGKGGTMFALGALAMVAIFAAYKGGGVMEAYLPTSMFAPVGAVARANDSSPLRTAVVSYDSGDERAPLVAPWHDPDAAPARSAGRCKEGWSMEKGLGCVRAVAQEQLHQYDRTGPCKPGETREVDIPNADGTGGRHLTQTCK